MKKTLSIVTIALLATACSSTPKQEAPKPEQLEPYLGMGRPGYITRAEVISATQECEQVGMRPRIVYATTDVQGKRIPVPVDVHCEPTPKRITPVSPYIPQTRTEQQQ